MNLPEEVVQHIEPSKDADRSLRFLAMRAYRALFIRNPRRWLRDAHKNPLLDMVRQAYELGRKEERNEALYQNRR